jgi:hypothetical protein
VLLVFGAPGQLQSLAGQEHGRTIPLANFFASGALNGGRDAKSGGHIRWLMVVNSYDVTVIILQTATEFESAQRYRQDEKTSGEAKVFRALKIAAVVVGAAIIFVGTAAQSDAESGRFQITLVKVRTTVEGDGSLFYNGKRYRLSISGISADDMRKPRMDVIGAAKNLRYAADIVGTYGTADAGTSTVTGARPARLQNAHGVILEVHGDDLNELSLNLTGMTIASRGWRSYPH